MMKSKINQQVMIDFLCEQLTPLGVITGRRMFGCQCVFINGEMTLIIDKSEQIFVKKAQICADDVPFCYPRQGKMVALKFVQIDNALVDDGDALVDLVRDWH